MMNSLILQIAVIVCSGWLIAFIIVNLQDMP